MRNDRIPTGQSLPPKSGFDLSVAKNAAKNLSRLPRRIFPVLRLVRSFPVLRSFSEGGSKRGSEGRPALRSSYEGASNLVKPIKVNQGKSR